MFKTVMMVFLLILPTALWAASSNAVGTGKAEHPTTQQTEQYALQHSLAAFFAAKPTHMGAVAVLESVTRLPKTTGEVRWSLPRLRMLSQRVSLIAEQGTGKSLRRWYVPVKLKWMAKVMTFKLDVSARAVLDRDMVVSAEKNIAGLRGQVWTSKQDVLGLKTLRAMRRGDVVLSTLVVRPPLIQRGDRVTILVNLQGLKVRAEGVALKSASRGERILVQNIRSRQTLQSIVQDAHTVAVHLGGV